MPGPSGRTRGVRMILLVGPLAALLSAGASVGLHAGPVWAQPGGVTVRAGGEEATVVADQLQQVGGATDLLIAVGNVEITRGRTRLLADRVELNRDTGQAVAQGKVVFYDGPDRLVGERIDYNLKTGTGVVYKGSAVSAPFYHLSAERMDRVGDSIYEMRRGVFTTCEGDDPPWSFRFGSGTADLDELVYGRDASFWVKGIPVLPWVPFFAAALRRERQSGFLFPEFGQSSRKGVFSKIPYFWAIDDSQDLTATLDAYSRRGVGLEADYRYVLSREHRGELAAVGVNEFLRNDPKLDENRGWASLHHDWQITPRMSFKVNANVTSDDLIFRDYGNRLADRANQRAETNVFVTQNWDAWSLVGNVKWYQDLTTARPIELQRVPEIKVVGIRQPVPGVPGLLYETNASFVNFIRDVGPDGVRADFHPRLLMPLPVAGVFTVTPFAGGRLTYYDERVVGQRVTRGEGLTVEESVYDPRVRRQVEWGVEAESRVSRVYTSDGGGGGGVAAYQHVIEPRVKIIQIRGVDQKDYPQYDPGASTATGIDPGYERRVGIDRLGKANEITYYLTNSLNAKTVAGPEQQPVRWEMMRFTLSQTFKMDPVSEPLKDLYADLTFNPNQRIGFHADARYNVYDLGLREANADIRLVYPRFAVAVGPRFNEQGHSRYAKAEALVKVLSNVDVRGSTAWDVLRGRAIENRVGIDWRFSCWTVMAEYVNRRGDENEFRISINLLGLGQVGTRSGF
jgi:LPS-assembly protein